MVKWYSRAACGLALGAAAFLSGCVTEPGRSDRPALWSSVETKETDDPLLMRNPARVSVAYGKVQEQRGQLSEARQHYQRALAEDSKSVDAIIGIARLDQYAGRYAEAESGFKRALKLAPKNPHVNDSVAMFYASQNRWKEAVASLQEALKGDPNNADYQKKLAISLAKTGNLSAAYQQFLVTVGEAEAHYYMGMILMERGQQAAAAQQFQLALMNAPDMDAARTKLAELNGGGLPATYANRQISPGYNGNVRSVAHTTSPNNGGYVRQPPTQPTYNNPEHSIVITPGPKQPGSGRSTVRPVVTNRSPIQRSGGPAKSAILPANGQSGNGVQPITSDQIQQWSNQYPSH